MIDLRPLRPGDVLEADEVAHEALSTMAVAHGEPPTPERTSEQVARAHVRVSHLQRTDPDGAWVAVEADKIVGIALALRRGPLWFLSLLAVATSAQARGIGRQLLAAALVTADGAQAVYLCASPDPKALRRYALAGFRLQPAYAAGGPLDRSLLPSGVGVRPGDWTGDGELVNDVAAALRGVGHGVDLGALQAVETGLLVAEAGRDRGFCIYRSGAVICVGATTAALAQRLLFSGLAEADASTVTVDWLTAEQQWGIEVAVAARLQLRTGSSLCVRKSLGPMAPYVPSGIYG